MITNEMKTTKDKSILGTNAFSLCLIGLVLATIYFNVKHLVPFNTSKSVIVFVTSGWLLGYLLDSYRKEKILLKSYESIVVLIAVFFIFGLMVSFAYSDVRIVSLIGETQRRNGVLSYIALIIIFLFVTRYITYLHAHKILKSLIALGALLTIYGVAQINGRDFVSWNNPYNSMIATLGNPNFASSFLALIFLVSTFSFFVKGLPKIYKVCSATVLPFALYAIIQSQSRQGLIVIGVGLLIYLNALAFSLKSRYRLYLLLVSLIVFGTSLFGMLQKGPLSPILYKDSVSVRGFYWRAGVKMFQESPLTGVGLDRYGSYFKQVREVEYPLRYGFDLTSSNAHNTFIQHFATGGILVGLSYLALTIMVLVLGIKLIRLSSKDENQVNLALISTWVAFQAQSLISIDNIGIAIWGWLLSGAIIGLYFHKIKITFSPARAKFLKIPSQKVTINLFQPVVSIIITIPIIITSFSLIRMESTGFQIRQILNSELTEGNKQILTDAANTVLNNPLADPFYKYEAATALVNVGQLDRAFTEIEELHKADPSNLWFLDWLAKYYFETKQYQQAINTRSQIELFDPWNAKNYLQLGILYKQIGNENDSRNMLNKILSFAPNTNEAKQALLELA